MTFDVAENLHSDGQDLALTTFRAGATGKFSSVREEMRYFLRDLGVDAVFTDNPDQFPTK